METLKQHYDLKLVTSDHNEYIKKRRKKKKNSCKEVSMKDPETPLVSRRSSNFGFSHNSDLLSTAGSEYLVF